MTQDLGGNVGLVVRFTLRVGNEKAFDELTAATASKVRRSEPDTLLYQCHRVDSEPRHGIFYELYRDWAAFEHHEQQPHVQHFLEAREPLIEDFAVDLLTPLTGT